MREEEKKKKGEGGNEKIVRKRWKLQKMDVEGEKRRFLKPKALRDRRAD